LIIVIFKFLVILFKKDLLLINIIFIMKDLILVGIQGSGKGTQARILAKKYDYQIFETGSALRTIAQEDSALGQEVKEITTRGDLVSNEIVMAIVADFIEKLEGDRPVIFDGIPRSEEQRVSLEKLLADKNREFEVLAIELSEKEAFNRMFKRAELEGRADDNELSMKKRIANFYEFTAPMLETWRKAGKLLQVCGEHSIEAVEDRISKVLN
jgi:adenylate kinase